MSFRKHTGAVAATLALLLASYACAAPGERPIDARDGYDPENVFARILRSELPAEVVFENEHALAFSDIRPQAAVHVLVIPKGPYANINRFNDRASADEKLGFLDAISRTAQLTGVDESGFRLISNTGLDGGQTVGHMHFHLLGGEYVGSPREAEPGEEGAPIEALYARYAQAWLRNDASTADAVLSLFSTKGIIVPSGGTQMYIGHDEMRAFWFPPGAPPSSVDRFDHEPVKATFDGHQGTLLSRFQMQFTVAGVSYRTEGFNQMSAIRDQGEWWITSMMWTHPPWERLNGDSAAGN